MTLARELGFSGSIGRVVASRSLKVSLPAALIAAAIALSAPDVRAQPGGSVAKPPSAADAPPPAPPPPPIITMPVVKKDEGASYPAQAIADKVKDPATVELVLELDATGLVTKATVDKSAGHGFDEAAIEAAKKLEFEPARRNGQPIAAKIRHKYVFNPPASRVVGRVATERGGKDAPLAGATITVTAADGTALRTTAAEDGSFHLDDLPAGTYRITLAAGGYVEQSYDETLDPGQEAKVAVRLAREVAVLPPSEKGEDVEEVEIRGTRPPREVTKRTLEQRELSRIPGTNGDALRAIQNLPGVARPPAIAGLLIVRGASPNETNIYVDGTLVPIVYHFGGLSSVIPTEMLEKIDFYPGNFSTYYGRVTGAIVDVGVHDPKVRKDKKIHGLAQADLIDARVLAEGPLFETGWNFAVAGRRSYVDLWLKPVLEQAGAGVTTAPVYYDYQLMLQRDFDKKNSLRLFFFGSDDRLQILTRTVNSSGVGGDITLGTAFYRFQARYIGKLSEDTELRVTAAIGKDAIDFSLGDIFFVLSSYPINPRAEISQRLAAGVRNNFGLDVFYAPYTVDARLPPPPRPGQPPPGPFGSQPPLALTDSDAVYRPALYDDVELTPWAGTRLVPGVRLDYAKDTRAWDVQPRLVVRQDLHRTFPRTTLKGGIGRFAQPPQPQETNRVFGVPGLVSNIANHYGAGVEQELTRQVEVSVEGFFRQYDRRVVQRLGNVGEGRAFGIETLLRYKPDERFFGFLAYTLSRSVRKDGPDQPERLFNFDQTHILTAVGSYRLGNGWEIGGRFRYVSGSLNTPQTYGFYDATVGSYIPLAGFPPTSHRNPPFHQLDVRIDKTWQVGPNVKIAAYLDIYNAYNQANIEGVSYNYNYTLSTNASGIPFLPSIGIRGEL
ncbi:MAG: TonB family protein / TonB-dependent receptor [Labilithrix sp.]|nr:TonB family protein / TonB-dependent receptor [Labilithrix sp.]